MADVFLGLGSNLGDRVDNIRSALKSLSRSDQVQIMAVSSFYESEPVGMSNQPDFVNCVLRMETELDPHSLLAVVKNLEKDMGRKSGTHMAPRPIDIDILLYDDIDLESLDLMIPHSRLKTRRFVLEPLLEIEPDAIDPVSSKPLKEFLKDVASQRLQKILDAEEVWDA